MKLLFITVDVSRDTPYYVDRAPGLREAIEISLQRVEDGASHMCNELMHYQL